MDTSTLLSNGGWNFSMVPSAIATLSKTGLLVENRRQDSDSPVLFVLPVVQSFMQQHGRIGKEIRQNIQLFCSQFVLDHYAFFQHDTPLSKLKALGAEDVNIQAILFSSPTTKHSDMLSDKTIEALISFSWYRCAYAKPNLEIAKYAVSMTKAFGDKKHIASSLWCMGSTCSYLGEYYAAYDHLKEAHRLYNTLLPSQKWYDLSMGFLGKKNGPRAFTRNPSKHELHRLCCLCGIDMIEVACIFEDGNKVVSMARDVEKQAATVSDNQIHARSLMTLGSVLDDYGDRREALRHLERAKQMTIASDSLIDVYYLIAYVHYHEKRLPEALDAAEEAWKISEPDKNLVTAARISYLLGTILFSANRDTEAWKYMEISLTNSLELGNRPDSAMALEYMGYGYLRRGDFLNAYGAYEAAAESYFGTVDEEIHGTACKNIMAKIKDMQRNPDSNVGFQRPRHDINWPSLFYPGTTATVKDASC